MSIFFFVKMEVYIQGIQMIQIGDFLNIRKEKEVITLVPINQLN